MEPPPPTPGLSGDLPRAAGPVWLLLADKLGDNAQVEAVRAAAGLAATTVELAFLPQFRLGKPRFRPSLDHLEPASRARLVPPWPALILTSGRRPSMVALWIRRQHPQTRIVLVGRPKRRLADFDLVVTLPQYRLPEDPRVLALRYPLMRADPARIAAAAAAAPTLAALPRPLTAWLVGGATKPFRLDAAAATALATAVAERHGPVGTLYVSTSRRTAPAAVEAIRAALPASARLYRYGDPDNPHLALLGLADRFVVTEDSISMAIEVASLGRPLLVQALPRHGRGWARFADRWPHRALQRLGLAGFSRDLGRVHAQLVADGLAAPFAAGGWPDAVGRALPDESAVLRERLSRLIA